MACPIRIGILNDLSDASPGPTDIERWLRLAADELITAGRLDREIEFIYASGLGLPAGSAAAVERAFVELVNQDALMIVGPAIGDNALVATPLAEKHGVPTINWAGSERARGDYMFHLQVGSHEDESIVIARHLEERGAKRIAAVYDKSPIGRRYFHFLQSEAEILNLDIAAATGISPLAEDAGEALAKLHIDRMDALVYLGLGHSAVAVAKALTAAHWRGFRIMNTAGIRGHMPEYAREVDNWVYLDMYSDTNTTLKALCHRPGLENTGPLSAAKGYDLGRLMAEGVARADELTREGVKRGLELVKWLPAAEGHDGTLLGFGHCDRAALHGKYLVIRQWQNCQSVQVG